VADHSLLVGIGDRTSLERRHRGECATERLAHALDVAARQAHPADVEPEAELRLVERPRLVLGPAIGSAHLSLARFAASCVDDEHSAPRCGRSDAVARWAAGIATR